MGSIIYISLSHPSLHETTRKFQLILFWSGFIFSLRNINVIMLWNKVLLLSLVKSNRMSVCAFVWWTGIGQRRFYTNAILGQDNTTLPKEIVLRHPPPQSFFKILSEGSYLLAPLEGHLWILIGWFIKLSFQSFNQKLSSTEEVIVCIIIGEVNQFIGHCLIPLGYL